MRVVIDTNVLISAIFWTGKPKQLLNRVRQKEIIFLTSEALLGELRAVLMNKDKPFKLCIVISQDNLTTINQARNARHTGTQDYSLLITHYSSLITHHSSLMTEDL